MIEPTVAQNVLFKSQKIVSLDISKYYKSRSVFRDCSKIHG